MLSSITRERGIDKEIFLTFHWEQGLVVRILRRICLKKKLMEYKMELKSYGVGEVLGWLKSLFRFFHKILQKNMNALVG